MLLTSPHTYVPSSGILYTYSFTPFPSNIISTSHLMMDLFPCPRHLRIHPMLLPSTPSPLLPYPSQKSRNLTRRETFLSSTLRLKSARENTIGPLKGDPELRVYRPGLRRQLGGWVEIEIDESQAGHLSYRQTSIPALAGCLPFTA
jgi:hypothetical protein